MAVGGWDFVGGGRGRRRRRRFRAVAVTAAAAVAVASVVAHINLVVKRGGQMQYEKTVGKLEPSYVIRKYLDAPRIQALTAYLKVLRHLV